MELDLFNTEENPIMAMTTIFNISNNSTLNDTGVYNPDELTPEEILYATSMAYRFKVTMSNPHNVISIILGFIALSSNLLSLLALTQVKSNLGSYFKLLMSLSISDILMGFMFVMHKISKILNVPYRAGAGPPDARLRSRCIFMVIKALNTTALNSTLLNLMAMAMDHYIAILKPLHYHIYVNDRRRHVLIATLWLVAAILGFSDFFSGITLKDKLPGFNYCEVIWITMYQEEFSTVILAVICFCIMMYIYIRIYFEVRKQQQRELQPRDLKKNKKALITTLLILGSFVLCWLPQCLFQIAMIIQVRVDHTKVKRIFVIFYKADKYLTDLLSLNAICDPIIYAFRMREVRQGYACLFYHCCKCCCEHPVKRRHSETITLDYTLSFNQHRKSSSAISNGSMPRKTEKSNSSHSTHSFPMLPTVIEDRQKHEEEAETSIIIPNGRCQNTQYDNSHCAATNEVTTTEAGGVGTEDKCLLLSNNIGNNDITNNDITKSSKITGDKWIDSKNNMIHGAINGKCNNNNNINSKLNKLHGHNSEEYENLVNGSNRSEQAQNDHN